MPGTSSDPGGSAPEPQPSNGLRTHRSRPLAGLLALLAGNLGLHRLYLGSRFWWVYPMLSLPLIGWALRTVPWYRQPGFFAFSLITVIALIEGIVINLTADSNWDARHNTGSDRLSANRWAPVILAVLSLIAAAMLGMTVMAIALESWFNARMGR